MPNDAYDALFDAWGKALNVDPQLVKTVFHLESSGGKNIGKSLPNDPDSPVGPMQIRPSTAAPLAKALGIPGTPDLGDMRWAVPLATQYLAQGLTATGNPSDAMAYYFGGPDPGQWGKNTEAYVQKGEGLYPTMGLKMPQQGP